MHGAPVLAAGAIGGLPFRAMFSAEGMTDIAAGRCPGLQTMLPTEAEGRDGLVGALPDAAIEHARANGATTLEAYPTDTGADRIASAAAYRGTMSMFERAGFEVVARRQAQAGSAARPIVRLEL